MTEPTDSEILDAADDFRSQYMHGGITFDEFDSIGFARAVLAKWGTPPVVAGEPVAYVEVSQTDSEVSMTWGPEPAGFDLPSGRHALFTSPQPTQAQAGAVPLTDREIELIDGMIQVQLDHASRCDAIANRSMADKQKGWDMERVALLQKFKAHGIKGGQHDTNT